MDMQSQMTRPYGHDQAEDPIKIHHPEEEEHQEKGASKVLKKVKEKAKKIKNSLTKHGHGHEHDHDVDEEDDEYDEQDPEVRGAPVYESSAVRGGVTGQHESLSHPGESNVPAPEDIIPPGTKFFPVVSSDYTRPIKPEPLQDVFHGHEAPSHPVRVSDREERREATSHPLRVSELSEREESRETHHMAIYTPVSLLSATEDVTRTFAPGEDEYLGGQRKVNIERPKGLEEDPAAPGGGSDYRSGVSNYQSKVTDPTKQGGGEAGVPGIVGSLGRMKVTDKSSDQKSGPGLGRDLPTRTHEFGQKNEFGTGKDSLTGFGGKSGVGLEDFPARSHELGVKTESQIGKYSPTGFGGKSGAGEDFPAKSHELGLKNESGTGMDSLTGFGGKSGAGLGDFPVRSHELGVKTESEIGKNSPTGFGGKSGAREDFPAKGHELGLKNESGTGKDSLTGFGWKSGARLGDFPARSHELGVKTESEIGKHSPTGFGGESGAREDFPAKSHELGLKTESGIEKDVPIGYDDESGPGLEKDFPLRSNEFDDVRVETEFGRDLPTETHDQYSPELSRPKERDGLDLKAEEARDETQEPKPNTYTEKIASATSFVTDKAIAAKNVVASKLGYSEGGQHEVHETPRSATGYGQKVAGNVAEKLTPVYEKVKETGSSALTKLPLSGGGSGAEKTEQVEDKSASARDYLTEKLRPGEEDKALSEVISEKLHLGEKKITTTKEVEVTVEKIPADKILEERELGEVIAEEGKGGGMVGKLKGAVTSWLGGTTDEVKPKTSDSVEKPSQSLGSTVGTMGFLDSGGGLQEPGN